MKVSLILWSGLGPFPFALNVIGIVLNKNLFRPSKVSSSPSGNRSVCSRRQFDLPPVEFLAQPSQRQQCSYDRSVVNRTLHENLVFVQVLYSCQLPRKNEPDCSMGLIVHHPSYNVRERGGGGWYIVQWSELVNAALILK